MYGEVQIKEHIFAIGESYVQPKHYWDIPDRIYWDQKPGEKGETLADFSLFAPFSPTALLRILLTYPEIGNRDDISRILFPDNGQPGPLDELVRELVSIAEIAYFVGDPIICSKCEYFTEDMRIFIYWGVVRCVLHILDYAQRRGHDAYALRASEMLQKKYDGCDRSLLDIALDWIELIPELQEDFSVGLFNFISSDFVLERVRNNNLEWVSLFRRLSECMAKLPLERRPGGFMNRRTIEVTPLRIINDLHTDFPRQQPQRSELVKKIATITAADPGNPIRSAFDALFTGVGRFFRGLQWPSAGDEAGEANERRGFFKTPVKILFAFAFSALFVGAIFLLIFLL
jgi:hypothetical protein